MSHLATDLAQLWTIAESVELVPDGGLAGSNSGSIRSRRNATGWFISAHYDSSLSAEAIEYFRHFVTVRTYLLLAFGAAPGQWTPGGVDDAFQADWVDIPPAELDHAMARL